MLPLRAIRLINTLACHNSPTVRGWMKASALFEARDAMLLDALHHLSDLDAPAASQLLEQLQNPLLADATVGLLLLRLLLDETADSAVRSAAGELLLHVDTDTRAQRTALAKTLDDERIFGRLFVAASSASAAASCGGATEEEMHTASAEDAHSADETDDGGGFAGGGDSELRRVATFLHWYHGAEGPSPARRDAACARLGRALQSSGSAARRAADKSAARRAKRARQRAEKISRSSTAMAKAVADAAERQKQRTTRGGKLAARRVAAVVESRRARLVRGERGWALRGRWVVETLLPAAGAMASAESHSEVERGENETKEEEEEAGTCCAPRHLSTASAPPFASAMRSEQPSLSPSFISPSFVSPSFVSPSFVSPSLCSGASAEEDEDDAPKEDEKDDGAVPDGEEPGPEGKNRRRKRYLRVPFSTERSSASGTTGGESGGTAGGGGGTAAGGGGGDDPKPFRARRTASWRRAIHGRRKTEPLDGNSSPSTPLEGELADDPPPAQAPPAPSSLTAVELAHAGAAALEQREHARREHAEADGSFHDVSHVPPPPPRHSRVPSGVPSSVGASDATSESANQESSA